MSYSHAADGLLAPRLQTGLQRFAKPWWRRRAVRIFRDESSLSANPHLWSSITDALDDSGWFILLLSPDAAQSTWVGQEIEYWKEHRDPARILPVLTDGTFEWRDGDVSGSAVPEQLRRTFTEEPRWVDLRFAHDEEQLDLKNPRFSAAVADIASALRGVPKDELESEEVKQHRQTMRTAWAAVALLLVVGAAAVFAAIAASRNAEEARRLAEAEATARAEAVALADAEAEARDQADESARDADRQARLASARELAASAIGVVDQDPRLAVWLTLMAIEETPEGEEQPVEVINALWAALSADPLLAEVDHGFGGPTFVDVSPTGETYAISAALGATLEVRSTQTHEILWIFSEETEDGFARPVYSPDGSLLAVDVLDSTFDPAWRRGDPDDLPNRVLVFDAETGEEIARLEYPGCLGVSVPAWSVDGSLLAVGNGPGGCVRPDIETPLWVEVFDTESWEPIGLLGVPETELAVSPLFVGVNRLGLFPIHASPEIYDTETFELVEVLEGIPDNQPAAVSVAGGTITNFSGQQLLLRVFDLETGGQIDVLGDLEAWPELPFGLTYSADGTRLAAATTGRQLIWDLPSGEQTFQLEGGASALNVAFSPDGSKLYSAHDDGTVRVWSLQPGGAAVDSLGSFPPGSFVNGNEFSAGDEIGSLARFQAGAGPGGRFLSYKEFFSTETGEIVAPPVVAFSASVMLPGDRALIGENEVPRPFTEEPYGYRLYDPMAGTSTPVGPTCPADVDLDCWNMGSATRDEFAIAFETDPRQSDPHRIEIHFFDATSLDPTDTLVLAYRGGQGRFPNAFGDDWLLIDRLDEATVFVDRHLGTELARVEIPPAGRHDVSPDGRYVAVAPEDRLIVLVDTETWEIRELELGFGRMRGRSFSPDSSLLAVADENEILIVDLASEEIIQELPFALVSDIHWIDDSTILIANRDGTLWARASLDISVLVQRAREAVADRPLSAQECITYRIDPCPSPEG